jgi:HK97 family phage prohead protease
MPNYLRAVLDREANAQPDAEAPLRFIASTEEPGRDGLIIRADAWRLDNYRRNPVVLWAHSYDAPPIGRADVNVEDNRLVATVTFDRSDPFAQSIERKYRDGFLHAVSVGWETLDMQPADEKSPARAIVTSADLLDISAVPVPGDPNALIARQRAALAALSRDLAEFAAASEEPRDVQPALRGAIPPHTTEMAPEDTPWDGPAEVAKAPNDPDVLRMMHAWVDDSLDPSLKRAYKLPHHLVDGRVVWRGVAAAMARLMQPGTEIPDADRRGVYNHLARHYRQFDREPPEFRTARDLEALSPGEIRGLFVEGEPELIPEVFAWQAHRAGAVLSARNRERLEQAKTLIQEVLDSATPKQEQQNDADAERYLATIAEALAKFGGH